MNLENKIEAILLYKNEPVSLVELSNLLEADMSALKQAVEALQEEYKNRVLVIISDGESISFGTNKDASSLIEKLQKEELSKSIGKAGLETLSIILYKGPITRREIDYIRGVNSGYIVRNLLVRGLIEKDGSEQSGRSFSYKPTLELLRYLGITKIEDLPEYGESIGKLEKFVEESTALESSDK